MTGDCWPTSDQTLLLQATLLRDRAAGRALEQWRSRVDLGRLDRGSHRLLPLLYQRLLKDAATDPLVPRLREVYDRAVSQNTLLIDAAAGAIRALDAAGIDTVLLKGMALIAGRFAAPGERPMADCDLLVPEAQAFAARDVLVREGWRLEGRMDAGLLSIRHAVGFRSPSGHQVDLHWHVLADCCQSGADVDFWRAVQPATLNGTATHTLCAADMVLHACVHGLRWSVVPPLRWATDALMVIRAVDPAVDWERVVDQAERHMLVLPMIDTLRYLQDVLEASVPEQVHARLARIGVPRWAQAEYRIKMRRRSPQRQFLFHWFQHRRHSGSGTLLGDLVSFPAYVRRRFRPVGTGTHGR